jgi:hypothetical protein
MMATTDIARRIEADDLAEAKDRTERILRNWDLLTWNQLLADDVALSLKVGTVAFDQVGNLGAVGGNLEVTGREDAKQVLKSIYGELKDGVSLTTEVISGYEAALLGNLAVRTPKNEDADDITSLPIVFCMQFDSEGKIGKLTIATVDLQPLTTALRVAAEAGAVQPAASAPSTQ